MIRRIVLATALAGSLVSCGGSQDSSGAVDTTAPVEGQGFANECERILGKYAGELVLSYGDMAPVKAEWPDNKDVQDLLEAVYLIAKPLVDKVTVGPAVNYMNEVIVNSCRDNDVYNWVQKLEAGDAGHKANCLDDKLPADIAKVEPCADDAPATTTSAP